MKLQANKWYKATLSYPTPRTVYTQQVFEASQYNCLRMQIKGKFCYFFDIKAKRDSPKSGICSIYSCTRETAKRKFNFEEI